VYSEDVHIEKSGLLF